MLDAELIKEKMFEVGVNVAQLSQIADVASNKLSQFLNCTRPIPNHEIARLRVALADLEELTRIAQPYPLSFRNTIKIRELISDMKRGALSRIVSPDAPQVV
jgi:hypothetical protein